MLSPPSTRPSDARGRRSSAFVRERHAPIDPRARPALSRSAGCVLPDPPGATWETTHGPLALDVERAPSLQHFQQRERKHSCTSTYPFTHRNSHTVSIVDLGSRERV